MPIKVFTTIDGPCPFGTGHAIDSQGCRKCQYFFRTGTAMFFWCNHPVERKSAESVPKTRKSVPKAEKAAKTGNKRGRPPGKLKTKPNKTRKTKKL